MKSYIHIFFVLFSVQYLSAQIEQPSLSPKLTTTQKVGLATITLEYGQPSVKGRKIFGSLIPYGKLWRTGANASTKITTNKEIKIANHTVPAGTYGLYSIPNKKEWTIILHKNSKLWGSGGYKQENDLIRFTVPVIKTKDIRETFYIGFENFTIDGATMFINWENALVKIPVTVNSDAIIEDQIKSKIANSTKPVHPQTYFDAAQYYYQKNKKLETALKWFTKAEELRPKAFWYTYYKAELALKLNKRSIAKEGAEKCLKAAKNNPSTDYGYIAKCSLLLKAVNK